MAEVQSMHIPRVKLGNQGLEVSKMGFGCMNLSGAYAAGVSEEEGISIIKHAFNKGITFFDTADIYGNNANEILVGKALKQLPREKIQIATKFGIENIDLTTLDFKINGTPNYVRSCCEASLKRLGVEYIDLYYQHRVDTTVPIEDTNTHPRYQAQNLEKNKKIYEQIENLGKKHQCSPVQLALAWVLQQGNDVVPIPGTTKIKNLDQNLGALGVRFEEKDLKEISEAVPIEDVVGTRHFNETHEKGTWKLANTPPKDSST
ncbi:hypothetical protein PIB30_032351 [Stylosanthes scabra]|uniref:NADP-dependent oxidoreductase domain-containing protein n=1 Tax=Stylosanthes scabra TaxID=79078 RepID=A0ABU6TBW0_9FABA|nr:hypothetical protein [Stylosanthes scabra]